MQHEICNSCETVRHCSQHGCIPKQPLKPCRSPYCECTPGTCSHPGCYDARGEQFKHPAPVHLTAAEQPVDNGPDYEDGPDEEGFRGPRPWNSFAQPEPYTAVRNACTGKVTYTCNTCGETDFRSEHAARFHICEPPTQPATPAKPKLRVYGWVWKQARNDGAYEPSYTPAQYVQRDELWALVDPKDLDQPLENTDWFAQ